MDTNTALTVREMEIGDIDFLIRYWLESEPDYLVSLGVDLSKLPSKKQLYNMLHTQLSLPVKDRATYPLLWLVDKVPSGHCNVNKIEYGKQAFMHLHLWQSSLRKRNMGTQLVKLSLPYFFKKLQLQLLYCEPYALNVAPNKTLAKVGFTFVKNI